MKCNCDMCVVLHFAGPNQGRTSIVNGGALESVCRTQRSGSTGVWFPERGESSGQWGEEGV